MAVYIPCSGGSAVDRICLWVGPGGVAVHSSKYYWNVLLQIPSSACLSLTMGMSLLTVAANVIMLAWPELPQALLLMAIIAHLMGRIYRASIYQLGGRNLGVLGYLSL